MQPCKFLLTCVASFGCAASPPPSPSLPAAAPASPASDAACLAVQTPDQQRDERTLRRIEHDWLTAELRGNAHYLECLLMPSYVNIRKDGVKRPGSELIARVRERAVKDLEIPEIFSTVVIQGSVATVYSASRLPDKNGRAIDVHFIDSYVFVDGAWHAYAGVDL